MNRHINAFRDPTQALDAWEMNDSTHQIHVLYRLMQAYLGP